jgi:PAS domain S-box-containing protein
MSYLKGILLAFILSAVAAAGVVSAYVEYAFEQSALDRLAATRAGLADDLARTVAETIGRARRDLEFLAARPEFRDALDIEAIDPTANGIPEKAERGRRGLLELLRDKDDRFSVLFVLTPAGDMYLAHPFPIQKSLKKQDFSDRAYFQTANRERRAVVSNAFIGADGEPAIAVNVPILDASGNISSHLGGVIRLRTLTGIVSPGRVAPFDAGFLADAKNRLIAHTDPERVKGEGMDALAPLIGSCRPGEASLVDPETGREQLTFLHPLDSGWCLGLQMDREGMAAAVRPQALAAALVIGGILLAIATLGVVVAVVLGRRWERSETALGEGERRYRRLFDLSPDGLVVHREGRIVLANHAAAGMLRLDGPSDLEGRPIADFIHPDFRESIAQRLAQIDAGAAEVPPAEERLLDRHGAPVDVEAATRRVTLGDTPAYLSVLRDVRERKRLQAERDRFFEIPLDLLCIADTHGYFRRLTPRWSEVLGWSEEELLASPYIDFIHPEDVEATREAVARLKEGKTVSSLLNRFRNRNGGYRWLEWSAYVEDGETIYAIARDVTVRRIHEAEIQRLTRRLDLILKSAGEGLCGTDTEGRITFVNPAVSRMLGWSVEELVGQKMHDLLHHSRPDGSFYPEADCPMSMTVRDGRFRHVDDEVLWRKDGTSFAAEYTVTPIEEEGRTTGAVVVFRDVTARRAAEAALKRNRALLECIGRAQAGFIGDYDPGGFFDTLLTDILRLTDSRSGFIAEACASADGRPCLETLAISDVSDDAEHRNFLLAHRSDGRGMRFEGSEGLHVAAFVTARPVIANAPSDHPAAKGTPEGHPRLASFLGLPLMRGDHAIGAIGIANRPGGYDQAMVEYLAPVLAAAAQIVEAHKQERQRQAMAADLQLKTAQLEASNNELQSFAYVTSHDLQEPLRMITSYLQLLERRYGESLDDNAREFIGYAVDGARRLQRLIKDLLEYSRVGTRGKPFAPTDMEKVLADALANLTVAIADARAAVVHDPLPLVDADETQMVSLLQNLIGNALKYRAPDRPPEIAIHVERTGLDWLFAVQDNGIGIDPQHFQRIFMVFQRLHGRQEYEGTGIGLAVCKKIVERHGGRIWVDSLPGRGSTFYFTLPAERAI